MTRSARSAALALFCAATLSATSHAAEAPKPVLTQNADEPGRYPYSESVSFINEQNGSCTELGDCTVLFNFKVPSGKRLVITYASAHLSNSLNTGTNGPVLLENQIFLRLLK
jgi:hypothetical protein